MRVDLLRLRDWPMANNINVFKNTFTRDNKSMESCPRPKNPDRPRTNARQVLKEAAIKTHLAVVVLYLYSAHQIIRVIPIKTRTWLFSMSTHGEKRNCISCP